MSYVKKLLAKNLWFIITILLIIVTTIILIFLYIRNSKSLEFLTIPKEYYIEYSEETYLETSIKCTRKDTMYLDKELINEVYIYDNITKEEYLLNLIDIKKDTLYEYENVNYYNYELKLLIPFKSNSLISLENCYMKINYLNDETLNFKLGKIFLYNKEESTKVFTISSLKGIVSIVNDKKTLSGVILSLKNEIDNLTITNIESLNNNVLVNVGKIKQLEHADYEATTPISEILGYEYSIYESVNQIDILYEIDKEIILFLPLSYLTSSNITTLGFEITYLLDDNTYSQIIEPFMFFKSYEDVLVDHFVYDFN